MAKEITQVDFTPRKGQTPTGKKAALINFDEGSKHLEEQGQALFEAMVFELQKETYARYQPELYEKIKVDEDKNPLQLPQFEIRETRKNPDEYEFLKNYAFLLVRHTLDTQPAGVTAHLTPEDLIQEFYARDRVLKSET